MSGALAQEKVIRIRIDPAGAVSGVNAINGALGRVGNPAAIANLNSQLNGLGGSAGTAGSALHAANDNIAAMGASASHASGGILQMVTHLGAMTLALAGIGFLTAGIHQLADAFIEAGNESTEVAARLSLVTNSTKEFTEAQANVAAIANQTRSALTDTAELYQKIGIQAAHLGASQSDVTTMTSNFAKTLKISGATTQQAQAAMRQLGEAFDQNTLQGRHFMAMQMDNIRFVQLLAESMHVSQGRLKELAHEGKVTGEELKKALTDPKLAAELQKQFDKMPVSFADVRMSIKNTLIQIAGDIMEGAGINTSLRGLYNNIAGFAESAKPTFVKIGVAIKAAFAAVAPVFSALLAAIGPFFSFMLTNAPELIHLLKLAAEGWLAYRVAVIAATAIVNLPATLLAVSTALEFATIRVKAMTVALRAMSIGGLISTIGTYFTELAAGIAIFGEACLAAVPEIGAMAAALWATGIPEIVIAITALVGAVVWFGQSTFDVSGQIVSGWDLIKATFAGAYAYVASVMGDIADAIKGPLNDATKFVNEHMGIITGLMVSVPALWPVAIYANWDAIKSATSSAWEAISSFVKKHALQILEDIPIIGPVVGMISHYWDDIVSATERAWTAVANAVKAHIRDIIASVPLIGGAVLAAYDFANSKSGQKAAGAGAGAFNKSIADSALARRDAELNARFPIPTDATLDSWLSKPKPPTMPEFEGGDGKKNKKDGDDKAKREKEFWETLKNEVETAGQFGIEAKKITEEQKLQKILGHDISTDQKTRIDNLVQEAANAKAVTNLKQAAFEEQNKYTLELQRGVGLTESQKAVEDELFKYRLSALNSGADITTASYKTEEAKLKTIIEQNQAIADQAKKLKDANDFAKKYSTEVDSSFTIAGMQKERDNFLAQFNAGKLKDALGKPMSDATRDGILAGYDAAAEEIKLKPLKVLADYTGSGSYASQALAMKSEDAKYDEAKRQLAAMIDITPEVRDRLSKDIERAHVEGMAAASSIVAQKWVDDMSAGIDEIANLFGGAFGDILKSFSSLMQSLQQSASGTGPLNKLANIIDGRFGSGFTDGSKSMTDIAGGIKNLSNPLKSLKDAFSGPGGSAVKGIGAAVGGALAGYQIGGTIGGIGSALGIKNFDTGAKIGGTIGGLTGNPIIAAAASVVGGIISSLFYKAPKGQATITGVNSVALSGTSAALKSQASGMAGGVTDGLSKIAAQLGATVGSFAVSIGTYKKDIRVNPTGGAVGGVKGSGAITYASEDEAVKAAIGFALKQGALQGLSDLAQKAVKSLDIDSAISFVQNWNSVMDDFAKMTDPVTAAVNAIIKPLDTMRDTMTKVGASTEDLNKLRDYETAKLKEALKSQLSTITDFMKALKGDGSGVTKLNQLTDLMAQFKTYEDQIAAGASNIDQSAFTQLGQQIFGLAKDVYGTATSQFQDIRSELTNASQGLSDNVTDAFNKAAGTGTTTNATATDTTAAAIQAQTDALLGQSVIQTDLLRQLVQNTTGGSNDNTTGGGLIAVNGRFQKSFD